ncbi:MAG: restriction endonuclease subunit S [Candidatus Shapirobacteria bacterium]
MNGWNKVSLSELGKVSRGKSKHRPRNDPKLYGGNYPFIQTADVKNANFYIDSYSQTYNEYGLKQSKLWDKDTLCITIAANIAESALLNFPACFPDSIVGFLPQEGKSDVRYVKYMLDNYKSEFQKRSKGATQDNLSVSKINSLKMSVPPHSYQVQIADIISTYDTLIDNNQKRIKILEEMAQRLYTEWFVKFKFPEHEKVKMVDSSTKHGKIPERWEVKKLANLINPQYGLTTSTVTIERSYKFLRGTDINKNSYIDWRFVPYCDVSEEKMNKYKISVGDVFIIRMADPGKIGICETNVNAIFASYLMRLNIGKSLTPYYLYYFLKSDKYQNFILGSSTGTTRKSINSKQVANIEIVIPSDKIMSKFEENISLLRSQLTSLLSSIGVFSRMRDLLIENLITGKRVLKEEI